MGIILLSGICYKRKPSVMISEDPMSYGYGDGWQEEKRALTKQLNETESDRATLRTYLQVDDTRDPRDVVELFDKLNILIKKSCLMASAAALKSIQLSPSWTTKDGSDLKLLQDSFVGANELLLSEKGLGRTAEEFLPLAFCYVVNSTLVNTLFALFHPAISKEENALLLDMYRGVRQHG